MPYVRQGCASAMEISLKKVENVVSRVSSDQFDFEGCSSAAPTTLLLHFSLHSHWLGFGNQVDYLIVCCHRTAWNSSLIKCD
jgi:hypothetical protein